MDETEKQITIIRLLNEVEVPDPLMNYFDYDSTDLLDLKIDVLEKMRGGTSIDDIDGGYRIFELLPIGQHWD